MLEGAAWCRAERSGCGRETGREAAAAQWQAASGRPGRAASGCRRADERVGGSLEPRQGGRARGQRLAAPAGPRRAGRSPHRRLQCHGHRAAQRANEGRPPARRERRQLTILLPLLLCRGLLRDGPLQLVSGVDRLRAARPASPNALRRVLRCSQGVPCPPAAPPRRPSRLISGRLQPSSPPIAQTLFVCAAAAFWRPRRWSGAHHPAQAPATQLSTATEPSSRPTRRRPLPPTGRTAAGLESQQPCWAPRLPRAPACGTARPSSSRLWRACSSSRGCPAPAGAMRRRQQVRGVLCWRLQASGCALRLLPSSSS